MQAVPHHTSTRACSPESSHNLPESTPSLVLHKVIVSQEQGAVSLRRGLTELNTSHVAVGLMREPSKAQANWLKAFAYAKDQAKHSIRAQANWARVFAATQKLVKGAFDGCLVLQESYYLEALDPKHEYGVAQQDYFEDWMESCTYISLSSDLKENYFKYLNTYREPLSQSDVLYKTTLNTVRDPFGYATDGKSKMITDFARLQKSWVYTGAEDGWRRLASGVDQFTAQESEKRFGLSIQGQQVSFSPDYQADWKQNIENSPRPSELIFVTDKEARIYAGFKERGIFHHSSFLSGAPVAMAGSLVVDHTGQLLGVSNLSGHYQPTEDHCIRFLHQLKRVGADLNKLNFVFAKPVNEGFDVFRGNARDWLRANSVQDRLHHEAQQEVRFQFEI